MPKSFTHEIRVGWGDCDPARIAYTANIPAWALEAIEAWWEHLLGGPGWYHVEFDLGWGTPFVHMELDFRAPITPRHRLICTVTPTRLGTSSIAFRVTGSQADSLCFEGGFVCVFIRAGSLEKRAVPPEVRSAVTPLLAPA
ncbi:MAG TPA: acyl-CoA thioesterase [Rhodobacteraceae bacterium]|nr:acyl-CoA thioesterase [Paracoccaceae bacterium]